MLERGDNYEFSSFERRRRALETTLSIFWREGAEVYVKKGEGLKFKRLFLWNGRWRVGFKLSHIKVKV